MSRVVVVVWYNSWRRRIPTDKNRDEKTRRPDNQRTCPALSNIIIIIIISAHKSDLSYPWSQTQASLSIPSLHPKNTNKRREREEKNNRRENLPRSDRRGREKIKQEQKNKSKDPPRISERQIDKQARQTKCQDHTNCRYRTRVAKHTPPVAGRGAADSQALRQGAPV